MKRSRPWSESRNKLLSDPAVRAEYDALEPEFALIQQMLDLRLKEGLSQRALAEKAGALNVRVGFISRHTGARPKSAIIQPTKRKSPSAPASR
jgi:hypothetical protein